MNSNKVANLNKYGFPVDAPITQGTPSQGIVPWQFGMAQKLQYKQIKLSKINIKNPGTISNIATATGTLGIGATLFILDTLTPQSPHGTEMNFAIPYVAVYEGTSAIPSNQIYPVLGANKSWGSYSFLNDFDWNTFATTTPGSIISSVNLTIHNNMGVAGTVFYVSQWKYINVNSGTVT